MTKRRTKKDRLQAKHHFVSPAVSIIKNEKKLALSANTLKQQSANTSEKNYLKEIFNYDPKLIVKDLRKTFFVVLFILLILLIIALIYT